MKVYIAGPMRGIPRYNFPAFDAARDMLESQGHEVVSPADIDRNNGFDPMTLPANQDWSTIPDGLDLKEVINRDLQAVMACDAMFLLPGWERSKGATAEFHVARWLGLTMITGGINND